MLLASSLWCVLTSVYVCLAPRVERVDESCEVGWETLPPMKGDPIIYCLQCMQGNSDFRQVTIPRFSITFSAGIVRDALPTWCYHVLASCRVSVAVWCLVARVFRVVAWVIGQMSLNVYNVLSWSGSVGPSKWFYLDFHTFYCPQWEHFPVYCCFKENTHSARKATPHEFGFDLVKKCILNNQTYEFKESLQKSS